ncbi:MAG: hypothetical protein ACYTXE_44725 [Nostoc sp.]
MDVNDFLIDDIKSFLENIYKDLTRFEITLNKKYSEGTERGVLYIQTAKTEISKVIEKIEEDRNNIEKDFYDQIEE